MRRVLYVIIFAILSFFVFSCDLKIKTWEDEEQSTPGAESVNVNKDLSYYLSVSTASSDSVVEFCLEDEA